MFMTEEQPGPSRVIDNVDPQTWEQTESMGRKRKFVHQKCQNYKKARYHFLSHYMTKPRTRKLQKVDDVAQKKRRVHVKMTSGDYGVLIHKNYSKSDLFFNDEKKANYEVFKKQDLPQYIFDEIALEGLDGITLEAFWKRLQNVFPINLRKEIKDEIWRIICDGSRHVDFYLLPQDRGKLINFDLSKCIDISTGIFTEPVVEIEDIYPFKSVNGTDIRGSCAQFTTRQRIDVRHLTLEEIVSLYDQKLVIVADQTLRSSAIISEQSDPNLDLLDVEYCNLERIGRARFQGELTHGTMSLQSMYKDQKNLHHVRKTLCQNFLITNQLFCVKSSQHQNKSGGLIHLTRFYNKRKPKQLIIMEQIVDVLRERKNYQMEFPEFRRVFGRSRSLMKIAKYQGFHNYFKTALYNYRTLHPNASKHEWKHKSGDKEKKIRVIQLIDPFLNVSAYGESKDLTPEQEESSESTHKLMNCEYLRDIYLYILSTREIGATIKEIHDYLGVDFYSLRMAIRKLVTRNVLNFQKIDQGRQQSQKYTVKFLKESIAEIENSCGIWGPNCWPTSQMLEVCQKTDDNAEEMDYETEITFEWHQLYCPNFIIEDIENSQAFDRNYLFENLDAKIDYNFAPLPFLANNFRIVNDFLKTINMSAKLIVDNVVVFDVDKISPNQISKFRAPSIRVKTNFIYCYSNIRYNDEIMKIFLIERLFGQYVDLDIVDHLRNVVGRVLQSKGKKRRNETSVIEPLKIVELQISGNVIIDKFMGPKPFLIFCDVSSDNMKTEVLQSTQPPKYRTNGSLFVPKNKETTQKLIDRANTILAAVNENKVIEDVFRILRIIREKESNDGCTETICRKSLLRILTQLVDDGYIKIFKLIVTCNSVTRSQVLICLPTVDFDNESIRTALEQLRMKFCVTTVKITKTIKVKSVSPFDLYEVKGSIAEVKKLATDTTCTFDSKYSKTIGRILGYRPKYIRMKVLHEFLYYLIFDFSGPNNNSGTLPPKEVYKLCDSFRIKMRKTDISNMPPIYCNEISWKMFIPPLPVHKGWPKGWILVCDVVLRLPLSVFVKLFNICYIIPELDGFLNHPVKRHYLLKYLPIDIRNILLYKRKYYRVLYEIICNLCYLGLVQMGPQKFREKDQIFVYLNQNASLYDTCTSGGSYHQVDDKKYKRLMFKFKSANDVEEYWKEMFRICMNTPLGKRNVMDGKEVIIETVGTKADLMATLKTKLATTAPNFDKGTIPGDHRGAAGLDSSMWAFLKKNWMWSMIYKDEPTANLASLKKEKMSMVLPKPILYSELIRANTIGPKVYLSKNRKLNAKKAAKEVHVKQPKRIVRKILAPKKNVRKYNDSLDLMIMKKNRHKRVRWDEYEDRVLGFSRAATCFLYNNNKKQSIPYHVIRNVLHRVYRKSRNKTAQACQRRLYWLLCYDETTKIIETHSDNLLNSPVIAKYFGRIHNRFRNQIKVSDAQIFVAFIYLMGYMLKNKSEIELLLLGYVTTLDFFCDPYIMLFELILAQIEENSKIPHRNPESDEDIKKDAIKSLIHCFLNCKDKSPGWTYQMFDLYRKFPDELIRPCVTELRKSQLLTFHTRLKINETSWHTPFRLSFLYNTMFTSVTYKFLTYFEAHQKLLAIATKKDGDDCETDFLAYNEINSFYSDIVFSFDVPEMGIILNPDISDHSEVIEELAHRFRLYLTKIRYGQRERDVECVMDTKRDSCGQHQADEKTEGIGGGIDEDETKRYAMKIIFRVPYLIEGDLEYHFKKMMESSGPRIHFFMSLIYDDIVNYVNSLHVDSDELNSFISELADGNVDDMGKLLDNLARFVFAIQHIQLNSYENLEEKFKLWEKEEDDEDEEKQSDTKVAVVDKSVEIQEISRKPPTPMDNCIRRALEDDLPSVDEIKDGMMVEIDENRKIPHITDLSMLLSNERFPELDADNETMERWKDHFVMQFPKLHDLIVNNFEAFTEQCHKYHLFRTEKDFDKKHLAKSSNIFRIIDTKASCDKLIMEYIRTSGGNENDFDLVQSLIDFIANKKQVGASGFEIKYKFSSKTILDLPNLLKFLASINWILRAGTFSIVFVHHQFAPIWLVETFILTPEEQEAFRSKENYDITKLKSDIEKRSRKHPLLVKMMPWSMLDGSCNVGLFEKWLCLVLSHCLDFPNILFANLCEHFAFIKPVDIFLLLELLQEYGCIEICVHNKIEYNLFSHRGISIERKATCLDNFEDMYIKTCNRSTLYLGSYLDKSNIDCFE